MTRPSPIPESEFGDAVALARAGGHAEAIERIDAAVRQGPLPTPRKIAACS